MPADSVMLLDEVTESEHFHAVIVEAVRLSEVDDVELDLLAHARVADAEKEPLCVTVRVDVVLQDQVVFGWAGFDGSEEIARFESRLKIQCGVIWSGRLVQVRDDRLLRLLALRAAKLLRCRHLLEVALVAVDVVLLDHLLDVEQVAGGAEVLHWLVGRGQVRALALFNPFEMLLAVATVDKRLIVETVNDVITDGHTF